MKNCIILIVIAFTFSLIACEKKVEKEKVEIHHAGEHLMNAKSMNVKIDNDIDPVCGMKTEGQIGDTIHYQGKVYGFCSSVCKEKFQENPDEYLSKLEKQN